MRNSEKTGRLVTLSILTALVVVLQVLSTFVKPGGFSITLALTPIVVGAAFYGKKAGAWLGGVFGVVVMIMCVTGADMGGYLLFAASPILTIVLCILKGAAAGFMAALVYGLLEKKNGTAAVVAAGVVSPVTNTGIFLLALYFLYNDTLVAWAGAAGASVMSYLFVGVAGINFVIELVVNAVLSPVVVRIIRARKKTA